MTAAAVLPPAATAAPAAAAAAAVAAKAIAGQAHGGLAVPSSRRLLAAARFTVDGYFYDSALPSQNLVDPKTSPYARTTLPSIFRATCSNGRSSGNEQSANGIPVADDVVEFVQYFAPDYYNEFDVTAD
uniref:Uncharacterized protein n=1 Tax=Tetradesmus obliquus TaxID=3088 RepID=A0A383V620_TETOB|eukprot:jgi/Sobl393_1/17551/SZX60403.1